MTTTLFPQNPWGTMADPQTLERERLAKLGWTRRGGDEDGGWFKNGQRRLGSPYGEEGRPQGGGVTLDGAQWQRIGAAPEQFQGNIGYEEFAGQMRYDPTYGWIAPEGARDTLTGLNAARNRGSSIFDDKLVMALTDGKHGGQNEILRNAPIVAGAALTAGGLAGLAGYGPMAAGAAGAAEGAAVGGAATAAGGGAAGGAGAALSPYSLASGTSGLGLQAGGTGLGLSSTGTGLGAVSGGVGATGAVGGGYGALLAPSLDAAAGIGGASAATTGGYAGGDVSGLSGAEWDASGIFSAPGTTAGTAGATGGIGGALQKAAVGAFTDPKTLFGIGSGLYGLWESNKMQDDIKRAQEELRAGFDRSDPFAPAREQAMGRYMQNLADPSQYFSSPMARLQIDEMNRAARAKQAQLGQTWNIDPSGNVRGSGVGATDFASQLQTNVAKQYETHMGNLAQQAGMSLFPSAQMQTALAGMPSQLAQARSRTGGSIGQIGQIGVEALGKELFPELKKIFTGA